MANTHSLDLESSSSQYASITDASQTGLDITGDMTIEAWVKLESQPADTDSDYVIVSKYDSGGNQRGFTFSYRKIASTPSFQLTTSSDGSTANQCEFSYTLQTGVWYHIAGVYDASAGSLEVYVNGLSAGTDTGGATSIYNNTAPFSIGRRLSGGSTAGSFDGLIDEVRMWNDIRTAQEIQDNLGKELVGNEAGLVGYWKLNNDYTDSTANGNDLTATNSPVFSTDVPFDGSETNISDSTTLTTNLVSYWKLDEESGTRADAHSSNDLTDNNTVGFGTGIIGNGADFEASNSEYLSITDASQTGLDLTTDFSFSIWVNVETQPSDSTMVLISKRTGTTNRSFIISYGDTSGQKFIRCGSYDSASGNVENSDINISQLTGFSHVSITRDGSAGLWSVYIDGVLINTATTTDTTMANSGAPFALGCDFDNSDVVRNLFDGIIDEVGVWSRVLTAGEISNLYNSGAALPYEVTDITVAPPLLSLTSTFNVPTLDIQATLDINAPVLSIAPVFNVPTLDYTNSLTVEPPVISLTSTLYAPTNIRVGVLANQNKNVATGIANRVKNVANITNRSKS